MTAHSHACIVLQVNETMLRSLVTYPDIDYFFIDNFGGLNDIVSTFNAQVCRKIPRAPCKTIVTSWLNFVFYCHYTVF